RTEDGGRKTEDGNAAAKVGAPFSVLRPLSSVNQWLRRPFVSETSGTGPHHLWVAARQPACAAHRQLSRHRGEMGSLRAVSFSRRHGIVGHARDAGAGKTLSGPRAIVSGCT